MLIDSRQRQPREVEALPALQHRLHQRVHLATVEALEVDRHQQRGNLIIGNLTRRVCEDELANLARLQAPAVAFAFDQTGYDHLFSIGVFVVATLTSYSEPVCAPYNIA